MRQRKNRARIFKTDRAREWAVDFMIGIGLFILVFFFASTHTDSALPAPLAKTQQVISQELPRPSKARKNRHDRAFLSASAKPSVRPAKTAVTTPVYRGGSKIMMVFMALTFSVLLMLTLQFWRNLHRAYALPRRK